MWRFARTLAPLAAVAATSGWSAVFAAGEDITKCGFLAGLGNKDGRDCQSRLRNGEISFDDIPAIIQFATSLLLGLTGTISMIAIIWGGFKYAWGAATGDPSIGKRAIVYGVTGFVISALSYFAVNLVINNL